MTDIAPFSSVSDDDPNNNPRLATIGICHQCVHREGLYTCAAFPDGIPREILVGDTLHTRPFAGDRGIQFKRNYR